MFQRIRNALKGLRSTHEAGQTLVEYGLIVGLISVAAILSVSMVAGGIDSLWSWIGGDVGNAVDSVLN